MFRELKNKIKNHITLYKFNRKISSNIFKRNHINYYVSAHRLSKKINTKSKIIILHKTISVNNNTKLGFIPFTMIIITLYLLLIMLLKSNFSLISTWLILIIFIIADAIFALLVRRYFKHYNERQANLKNHLIIVLETIGITNSKQLFELIDEIENFRLHISNSDNIIKKLNISNIINSIKWITNIILATSIPIIIKNYTITFKFIHSNQESLITTIFFIIVFIFYYLLFKNIINDLFSISQKSLTVLAELRNLNKNYFEPRDYNINNYEQYKKQHGIIDNLYFNNVIKK